MIILAVAAHPDDEVLGCGATLAQLARDGHEVYIAILGEGITSRYQQRVEADQSLVDALHVCSQKAAKILGVQDVLFFNLPDNRFDTLPLLDVVKIVEELIERLSPTVIYTHHGGDLNIDHMITHRAVLTATRPTSNHPVKELYTFEVPSSTEWAFGQFSLAYNPNVFVDIRGTLDSKIQAMEQYEGELKDYPHPRSPQALTAIAQRWGTVIGAPAAEAFQLVRMIR